VRTAPAFPPSRPGGGQTGHGSFTDQITLEFGQGREDAKDHATCRCRCVDLRALARQHLQSDVSFGQLLRGVDQMSQGAPLNGKF
jgi:hypothetical protein